MKDIKIIGLDLAKSIFYVHGVDINGKTVLKKKLTRSKVLEFFANLSPCIVGMEAGGGSHYWAREIGALGHDARLMAPQFVKPYVKTDKTDSNDAEAICEAVSRPSMRFVPIKGFHHQDIQSIHRIRERIVTARTALANEIRGFLGEYGIVMRAGIRFLIKELPNLISDESNKLTPLMRDLLIELSKELGEMTNLLSQYNDRIEDIRQNNPVAKRLSSIPGVGPIAATAIVAHVSDPNLFRNGREFAAYLGLVPKQRSSGGKQKLLGISKRGDKYIRTMLVHGARVAVTRNDRVEKSPRIQKWVQEIKERRGFNKATVALANKNARIAWAIMVKGETFSWAS